MLINTKPTDVFKVSKDKIKKYEENKLGRPMANSVSMSFFVNLDFSFIAKNILESFQYT